MKELNELLDRRRDELDRGRPGFDKSWQARDAHEKRRLFIKFMEQLFVTPTSLEIVATVVNLGAPDRRFKFIITDLGDHGFGVRVYDLGHYPYQGQPGVEVAADDWLDRSFKLVSESREGVRCFHGEGGLEAAIKAVRMAPSVIPNLRTSCGLHYHEFN